MGARLATVVAIGFSVAACARTLPRSAATDDRDAAARAELDRARRARDVPALVALGRAWPASWLGGVALDAAIDVAEPEGDRAAAACDEVGARRVLAPFEPVAADVRIAKRYRELRAKVDAALGKCGALARLDAEVEAAEGRWDWPRAFTLLDEARDVDPDVLATRRTKASSAWERFVDDVLARIVAKRSAAAVLGARRAAFLASVDPGAMPSDVSPDIERRARRLRAVMLVFDQLAEGELVDPPKTYWTFGAAPTRTVAHPELAGNPLPRRTSFTVVARAKLDGVTLLAAGNAAGDPGDRLESISALVVESSARPFDTATLLPPDLEKGDRVLAPLAAWPAQLALHEITSIAGAAIVVRPLAGGAGYATTRAALRAPYVPAGVTVLVPVGRTWRRGVAVAPIDAISSTGDAATIDVDGGQIEAPAASIRVERSAMPAPAGE